MWLLPTLALMYAGPVEEVFAMVLLTVLEQVEGLEDSLGIELVSPATEI